MCSYNKINDTHACQNNYILNDVLKTRMNFSGWVMSDWLAPHSSAESANGGLDQEMPYPFFFGLLLREDLKIGKIN